MMESELKVKPGDTFWELNRYFNPPYIYPRIAHTLHHCEYATERWGKVCFGSKEEALAKLKSERN